jgi:ribonuclease VapC
LVLHSSALLALLFDEPEASAMVRAVARGTTGFVGAPTLVEASAVLTARKGSGGEITLGALLERMKIEVVEGAVSTATEGRGS